MKKRIEKQSNLRYNYCCCVYSSRSGRNAAFREMRFLRKHESYPLRCQVRACRSDRRHRHRFQGNRRQRIRRDNVQAEFEPRHQANPGHSQVHTQGDRPGRELHANFQETRMLPAALCYDRSGWRHLRVHPFASSAAEDIRRNPQNNALQVDWSVAARPRTHQAHQGYARKQDTPGPDRRPDYRTRLRCAGNAFPRNNVLCQNLCRNDERQKV